MDGPGFMVTANEFKLFYGIDRSLYLLLVRDLFRNPLECLYVMGVWMWLERGGFTNIISKILSLPPFLIYELADEAVACLKCLNPGFPFSSALNEIPMTCSLLDKDITFLFFYKNRPTAFHEIKVIVNEILLPTVSDIMEKCRSGDFACYFSQFPVPVPGRASSSSYMKCIGHLSPINHLAHNFSNMSVGRNSSSSNSRGKARAHHEATRTERTMFVTFSKGYPVTEAEVTNFFTKMFGICIEAFHMQEVGPNEQALYARIVFSKVWFIHAILNGELTAKYTINGKHVWLRKFVPRNSRPGVCGCPNVDACICVR